MRKKVSTLLEQNLYLGAKLEAARQGRQISEIIGEALTEYLRGRNVALGAGGAVASSWGALKADPSTVRAVLEEEDGLFDA
jgi:hypothetical protein